MANTFDNCFVPWKIWPWGLTLHHEETDFVPECSVEFGGKLANFDRGVYIKLDFELATYVSARPKRDDEDIADVTGYHFTHEEQVDPSGQFQSNPYGWYDKMESDWQRTGLCGWSGVFVSNDSVWLNDERARWSHRVRADESVNPYLRHFLVKGRDGYLEILATGFSWRVWPNDENHSRSSTDEEPSLQGVWKASEPSGA